MSSPDDAAEGPHRIRLRGPWEAAWIDEHTAEPVFQRFHFPGAWRELAGPPAPRAVLRRGFSRPANLDADERVTLVCEGLPESAAARLNGQPLSPSGGRWDITERLALRNSLELELPAVSPEAPILLGEVRLEIDSR